MMYCVKEKKCTENVNPRVVVAKNGCHMLKTECASCEITKTMFIKVMLPFLPPKRSDFTRVKILRSRVILWITHKFLTVR